MNSLPDVRGTRPGDEVLQAETAPVGARAPSTEPSLDGAQPRLSQPGRRQALQELAHKAWNLDIEWRFPLLAFVLSRLIYLVIMGIDHFARTDKLGHHWDFRQMISNWDGYWYLAVAKWGYFHHLDLHGYNTLGFLPLYPMLIWIFWHGLGLGRDLAAMVITTICSAIATVLITRLAARWWDELAARKAIVFLLLFPGSIVFSMAYSEGLLLALVAGSMLAIEHRRWILAGVLAGLATAVEPVGEAIIVALVVVAFVEVRARGWRDVQAMRSVIAAILSPIGAIGFAIFLWFWTGTPLASFNTQKIDWHETTTPLAVPRAVVTLVKQAIGAEGPPHPNVDLNLIIAVLGTILLVWGFIHVRRGRRRLPLVAATWTIVVALMTLTSNSTPPNARMLLCAFPLLLVLGAELTGRAYKRLIGTSFVFLVAMSMVTFVSTGLRP